MREYSTPLHVRRARRPGNLTDDVVRNATEHPDEVAFSRRAPTTAGTTSPPASSSPRWRAVAKGLVAAGVERRATGSRCCRKTRYEWTLLDYAIWYAGAVTVPIYETSSAEQVAWILADSGARAVVVETPEHTDRIAEVRRPASRPAPRLVDRGQSAVDVLGHARPRHLRRRARGPADGGRARRPRHADLHLRHHRPAQGLHAHPRQLHVRARRRRRRARQLFDAEDASTLLFLPLAHVFARIIQVGAVKARVRLGHSAGHQAPARGPRRLPADVHPRRCPGSSRRCSTPPPSRPPPTAGAGSSTGPPRPRSPTAGRSRRPARARCCGCGTRCSTGSSTPGCARRSAAAASTPSPGARRWASGSATSTAASGSPSSRATG